MRVLKHFIKVTRYQFIRITCKHTDSYDASCPFTGKTYTLCVKCAKRLFIKDTNEAQ